MKIRWIRLKISTPLLLGLQEGIDEAGEQREWRETERNVGFYPQEGKPYEEP